MNSKINLYKIFLLIISSILFSCGEKKDDGANTNSDASANTEGSLSSPQKPVAKKISVTEHFELLMRQLRTGNLKPLYENSSEYKKELAEIYQRFPKSSWEEQEKIFQDLYERRIDNNSAAGRVLRDYSQFSASSEWKIEERRENHLFVRFSFSDPLLSPLFEGDKIKTSLVRIEFKGYPYELTTATCLRSEGDYHVPPKITDAEVVQLLIPCVKKYHNMHITLNKDAQENGWIIFLDASWNVKKGAPLPPEKLNEIKNDIGFEVLEDLGARDTSYRLKVRYPTELRNSILAQLAQSSEVQFLIHETEPKVKITSVKEPSGLDNGKWKVYYTYEWTLNDLGKFLTRYNRVKKINRILNI